MITSALCLWVGGVVISEILPQEALAKDYTGQKNGICYYHEFRNVKLHHLTSGGQDYLQSI